MKSRTLSFLVCVLAFPLFCHADGEDVNVPWTWSISSDYGPRENDPAHDGIDYAAPGIEGKDIPAAQGGNISEIFHNPSTTGYRIIVESSPWLIDTAAEVGVMLAGYADGVGHTLGAFRFPTALVDENLRVRGPERRKLADLKVLIIPSGALTGKNTGAFRAKLSAYSRTEQTKQSEHTRSIKFT